ncbi:MAG: thermonuclease family protein [Planctomycetota bacterium]
MSPSSQKIRQVVVFVAMLLCLVSASGCFEDVLNRDLSLPAPLRDDFPYEFEVSERLFPFGGDNFQSNFGGHQHYFVIRGVIAPKPGQDFYQQSRKALRNYFTDNTVTIVVHGRDDQERESADVFVEDVNVGLTLIKDGLAWWSGAEFDGFEQYRDAQAEAEEQRSGLWGRLDDPIHPADFEQLHRERRGW